MTIWLVALALWSVPTPPQQADNKDHDPIVDVSQADPAMEAAKRAGRAALPDFYRHYAAPAADESSFSVKFDLLPGPSAEFIWARVISRDGATMVGELGNAPRAGGYKIGQRVTIAEADVIDWQYLKGKRMIGHYTTRVLLERMPADEAQGYREALGW